MATGNKNHAIGPSPSGGKKGKLIFVRLLLWHFQPVSIKPVSVFNAKRGGGERGKLKIKKVTGSSG